MRVAIVVLALLALAAPAAAQRRDLPVPLGKGWQHADSGVILTATLAGLPRTTLTDNGTAERDIAAEFASPDRATVATIHIFRPALMSVPIWFDRAQTAIALRDIYGGATPVAPLPTPFAHPGAAVASGLRQVYVPGRGKYKSTTLAVSPVGAWLVAVRLSATTLDPAAADAKLSALIAAIRWPTTGDSVPVAKPVGECADGLTYHKAAARKPDMMQALLGGAVAAGMEKDHPADATPVEYCRDPVPPTVDYAVYRAMGTSDGYTLAIADSGRIASVYKGLTLPGQPSTGGYAVTYADLDGSIATFPSFDQLPQPQQVLDLVLGGHQPIARTATGAGGKTGMTIGLRR
ncbi:hypothetical protein [Sphingomonas bacterium]|uniref:hypothetical protein n=1 Tax=Sphingomonas bacterium TaxID=1895847 RepID=UPI00157624B9|nr:hypothetical protein [Sphingomonas bacterium]